MRESMCHEIGKDQYFVLSAESLSVVSWSVVRQINRVFAHTLGGRCNSRATLVLHYELPHRDLSIFSALFVAELYKLSFSRC